VQMRYDCKTQIKDIILDLGVRGDIIKMESHIIIVMVGIGLVENSVYCLAFMIVALKFGGRRG
jgi:hypothetical protein